MRAHPSKRAAPWLVLLGLAAAASACWGLAFAGHLARMAGDRWYCPVPWAWNAPEYSTGPFGLCSLHVCQGLSRSYPTRDHITYADIGLRPPVLDTDTYTLDVRGYGAPWPFLFVREYEVAFTSGWAGQGPVSSTSTLVAGAHGWEAPIEGWTPVKRNLPLGSVVTVIRPVALVGDAVALLAIGMGTWYAISRQRALWRIARGRCGSCGYDLDGSTGCVCPECGA